MDRSRVHLQLQELIFPIATVHGQIQEFGNPFLESYFR